MKIGTHVSIEHHEPQARPCSLLTECVIEPGTNGDYKKLAVFHYRDHRVPPAIHQVYRARHVPTGRSVGAIVYAAPALNLGVRNAIFGDRYKIGGGRGTNDVRAARLNREVELIIRVVVHSTFRGTGLGVALIKETLGRRPYQYIEMSAAMGSMNPFAEKAGMQAVRVTRPENTERVLSALRSVGMTDEQMGNPAEIMRVLHESSQECRRFLAAELERFALRWIKSRTKRDVVITTEIAARRVAGNALLATTYYLYENPSRSQGADHAQAENADV